MRVLSSFFVSILLGSCLYHQIQRDLYLTLPTVSIYIFMKIKQEVAATDMLVCCLAFFCPDLLNAVTRGRLIFMVVSDQLLTSTASSYLGISIITSSK